MKFYHLKYVLILAGSFLLWAGLSKCNAPKPTPVGQIKETVTQDIDSLAYLVEQVMLPLAQTDTSSAALQRVFHQCRQAYKKIEYITEYFMPGTSRFVNGPPLDEIETTESEVEAPGGFQVVEEYLFPQFDAGQRNDLVREVKKLQAHLFRIRTIWKVNAFTDAHVFDAMRLQTFRIITLGISGFDTPLAKNAMEEAAVSLASLQNTLQWYAPAEGPARQQHLALQQLMQEAETYLRGHKNFDTFDRIYFITTYANPVSEKMLALQQQLGFRPLTELRALRGDAPTLFAADAFDVNFFAPDPRAYLSHDKVELGKKLFYDPVLSSDHSRSCATCHQPEKAFTDGLARSAAFVKGKFIKRNAPTLLNAAFQHNQFYDARSTTLEHQAIEVVENEEEMHGSLTEAVKKLHQQPAYVTQFKKAFGQMQDSIQPMFVQNAIASYIRSLVSFNARFDQYMRGDQSKMNAEEIRGFNLFMGKAKCGTCHFMPLFNGTVPPAFTHTESEVIGVPARATGREIDGDLGRYAIHSFDQFKHAFKTPTVRNVALTAPYMHNGVYQSLEEVIDFYDRGGGTGLGMDLPNQTLPGDSLHLDSREKKALIAFMQTLTDTTAASQAESGVGRLPAKLTAKRR